MILGILCQCLFPAVSVCGKLLTLVETVTVLHVCIYMYIIMYFTGAIQQTWLCLHVQYVHMYMYIYVYFDLGIKYILYIFAL